MSLAQIREDIMHLAGRLPHRSAQSDQERNAAHYIQARLSQYTPDAALAPFRAPESHGLVLAAYVAEFLFVGLLALFWPGGAFGYGLGIFFLYLLELCGYRGLSRFFPQYPSQNVTASLRAGRPEITVILCAHYDSGCATTLSQRSWLPWLRPAHGLLLASMVTVIATCVVDGAVPPESLAAQLSFYLRGGAILVLIGGAAGLYFANSNGEDVRGAVHNASGVGALIGLAEKFAARPVENVELVFVAAGAHESWMAGLRHLLADPTFRSERTWFINLEGVGAGTLHFLSREGFVHTLRADPGLVEAARRLSKGRPVREGALRAIPTAAHVPLMRGMRAMTLMGLDRDGYPPFWNSAEDRISQVDESGIAEAIEFTELLIRDFAATQAS